MTKRLKLTAPVCPVASRRFAVMDRLEEERDLLCIGRPSLREIGAAWAAAGVGIVVRPVRAVDVRLTRRGMLGLAQ
jgi:hypothetical protein